MFRCILFIACAFILAPVANCGAAEDASASEATPNLSRSTDVDIRELVLEVGRRQHRTFLLDPRVRGSVDLEDLKPRDVTYPILLAIFRIYGYAAFAGEGFVSVVPDASARQLTSPIVDPHNIKTPDDLWITTLVPVKNVSAAQLVPVLRPLMAQSAQLSPLTGRNALLIVDVSSNVKRLIAIIDAIDNLPVPAASTKAD